MIERVAVCGASGKMGREVVKAISRAEGLELVGGVAPHHAGRDCGELAGVGPLGRPIVARLEDLPEKPDVMVDFTHPSAVKANVVRALQAGVRAVVGTTGLFPEDLSEIARMAEEQGVGAIVAPNFALGAVLLMRFAAEASRYFDHAEILELHHNQKADAPSGTDIKTAEMMLTARDAFGTSNVADREMLSGARGANFDETGLRIHAIRLPGLVAHQEVIFGGLGQTLTIRHDSLSRESFMPGVLLAVRKVLDLKGLVYGLEKLV